MGVAVGDYDNDGFPDLFVTAYGASILYHNNGDGTFTDVTEKAGLGAVAGMDHQRRLVRLRQRRPTGPVRLQLRRLRHDAITSPAATTSWAGTITAFRASSSPPPASCSTTTATARSPRSGAGTDIEKALGKGPGRGGDRHQQRRPDGSVRRQRHGAEFPVRESRARRRQDEVGGDRAGRRGGIQRQRAGALRHGRGRRRLRRRRLAGPLRRQRGSGDVLALPEQRERDLHRRRASNRAWRRPRAC